MSTEVTDMGFDPDEDQDAYVEDPSRRGRGYLTSDVNRICKMFVTGEIELEEGKFMTPWVTGRIIKDVDVLDSAPSSGAIARVFHQWKDWKYATFRQEPFAFVDFTKEGLELGLEKFKQKLRMDRREAAQKAKG